MEDDLEEILGDLAADGSVRHARLQRGHLGGTILRTTNRGSPSSMAVSLKVLFSLWAFFAILAAFS